MEVPQTEIEPLGGARKSVFGIVYENLVQFWYLPFFFLFNSSCYKCDSPEIN